MSDRVDQLLQSRPGGSDRVDAILGTRAAIRSPLEGLEIDKSTPAGFTTLSKAAMVDDPQTRLRIFAKDLFPGVPEEQAIQNVGMVGDEVVYLKDGKLYQATPSGFGGWMEEAGANIVGNLPAVVGGTVGGISGVPGGPGGIIGMSALGAAGGKGFGKVAANLAFDEPQTVGGNIKSMLVEGAYSGAGSLLGLGVAKWFQRHAAKDIGRLAKPEAKAAASGLQQKAAQEGIDLTPAEITNLPSLKAQQKMLSNLPQSADVMDEFYTRRTGQIQDAVGRFLSKLSPVEGAEEAGAMAREAAKGAIKSEVTKRAQAASPLYRQAFQDFQGVPQEMLPVAEELMKKPAMKEAARVAVKMAANDGLDLTKPSNSLVGMHYMKLALDDMIGSPKEGLGAVQRGQLVGLKNQLVGMMDELSPAYKQARGTYAHFSPNVTQLKEGPISRIADLGDDKLAGLAERMFNPKTQGPLSVSQARVALETQDPAAWQALKRSFLQQKFEEAGKQFASRPSQTSQGPKFWAAMMGSTKQREILKEAMTTSEWKAFNDLMSVLEASSRVPNVGSDTAWNEAAKKLLESEASGLGTKAAQTIASPLGTGRRIAEWVKEARAGAHAQKLAEVVTSKNGMAQLKQLRQLSPTDQKFIAGTAALLGVLASPDAEDRTIEQIPPVLQRQE